MITLYNLFASDSFFKKATEVGDEMYDMHLESRVAFQTKNLHLDRYL